MKNDDHQIASTSWPIHASDQPSQDTLARLGETTTQTCGETRAAESTTGETVGRGGATGLSLPTLSPWLILILCTVIQMLLSPSWPSTGVHAEQSEASTTNSDTGGSSSSKYVYGSQYFRTLPPILSTSKTPGAIISERMNDRRRLELREEAKQMFLYGYEGYIKHAFPMDELNPIVCKGRGSDKSNENNLNVNDVLGDFSLTMIDSLDTLATMREPRLFQEAVDRVIQTIQHFHINSRVQVFEVNIRVLGALLSAHLYATDPSLNMTVTNYKDELLHLATDLGRRLMKAFEGTATGIPWPRVNLKQGVVKHERTETCAAGAGSLLLEFGVLSRLTGDPSFENAAKNALRQLWDRRTDLGLVGNTIDVQTGQWLSAITGIGAGTDSFYEYLIKSYVLFGDAEYLEMYESAAASIHQHLLHETGYFYKHVHVMEGHLMATWVDSLSAFMPGVQVLAGDLESAIKNHLYYFNIWRKYQAIPERFNFVHQDTDIENYPLRPEFVESTYFLYRATKDPFYLQVGEMVLQDLRQYTKTRCGWASLASVKTKKQEDRMESFALSETFKYLFLLFDEENMLHQDHRFKDSNFVFTTEGHVLFLRNEYLTQNHRLHFDTTKQSTSKYSSASSSTTSTPVPHQQPICMKPLQPKTFLKETAYRSDFDFARQLVGVAPDTRDHVELDPQGACDKPHLESEQVIVEFSGPSPRTLYETEEDEDEGIREAREYNRRMFGRHPPVKVKSLKDKTSSKDGSGSGVDGVYIDRLIGVKLRLMYDPSFKGYRANRVEDHSVHPMEPVYVDLTSMQPLYDSFQRQQDAHLRIVRPLRTVGDKGGRGRKEVTTAVEIEETNFLVSPATFGTWHPLLEMYDSSAIKRRVVEDKPSSSPLLSYWGARGDKDHGDNLPVDSGIQVGENVNQVVMDGMAQGTTTDKTRDDDTASNSSTDSGSTGNYFFNFNMMGAAHRKYKGRRTGLSTFEMVRISENAQGCRPYHIHEQVRVQGKLVIVDRGACLFILKAYHAQAAGASGIVVINTDNQLFQMTGNGMPKQETMASTHSTGQQLHGGMVTGESLSDDDIRIPAVMIKQQDGVQLLQWIQQDQVHEETVDSHVNRRPRSDSTTEQEVSPTSAHSNVSKNIPCTPDDICVLDATTASANTDTSPSASQDTQPRLEQQQQRQRHRRHRGIEAGFVQQKLTRQALQNARLTYNKLPILNIQTLSKYRRLP